MAIQKISLNLLLTTLVSFIVSFPAYTQHKGFEDMIITSDSLNMYSPREKIFIHRDKPYYKTADTIWFKGYIVTAPQHIPHDSSGFAYVEIINAQNKVVKRISTPCILGLFAGNIILDKRNFPQGEYLLRAWTRYMRNFDDSLFFGSRFTIIDPSSEGWKTRIHQLSLDTNRLRFSASLAGDNSRSIANRRVWVRLLAKNKIIFRTRALTDASGTIYIDTLMKNMVDKNLRLEIGEQDHVKLQLPVKANEKKLIDLQFLPEGGRWVAGKSQRLGFKAINISGKSIDVKGVIKDSKGSVITAFASIHKGMGIVSLAARAGEIYTAVLENGLSFPLPLPDTSGIILQVVHQPGADSLVLRIEGTPDLYGKAVSFAATSRGIIAARGRVIVSAKGFELSINRKQFRDGITLFTVYDEKLYPINERAIFIWHNEELQLKLSTHKDAYLKKDSVSLSLKINDNKGKNIAGTFSLAVLDTSQVKVLPDAENLLSYILLASDLKGEIEEPYYYFKQPNPEAVEALMLTQGWVGYNRKIKPLAFPYEKEFVISGRVSNIFNKPLSGTNVVLFGKAGQRNTFFSDTITNASGGFVFNRFVFYENDSVRMLIKALNKKGKAFNVGIELNQPVYPEVNTVTRLAGANEILIDTIAREHIAKQKTIREELKKDGVLLQEVIVTAKYRVPGSKNLNEDGGADQTITEETLNQTPKKNLLQVLQERVPGFHMGTPPRSSVLFYMIYGNLVRLVIDGVDMHFFFQSNTGMPNEYVLFLDSYLKYFSAEDIKGIEIMNSTAYNSAYRAAYLNVDEQMATSPATIDFSFIEITTQTGEGPFPKKIPGMYLLRPLYPVLTKQFYSPKYQSPSQETVFPDLRSTVYWEPNIITNEDGEALVSFYTSESNSSGYLVIVQGTDLKGNFGVLYQPLLIRKDQSADVK